VPELPEVETLRRGLERGVLNRRIAGVEVKNAKVLKGQSEAVFRERVLGKRIARVDRRGKYLLVSLLADGDSLPETVESPGSNPRISPVLLCIHLKMRGQLRVSGSNHSIKSSARGDDEVAAKENASPYLCIRLQLDAEEEGEHGKPVDILFEDMWTWGEMRALTKDESAKLLGLAKMGPEPLEAGWDGAALAAKLAGRKGPIKTTLLDQSIVAGVGNIYADESLFRAGINPERIAGTLSAAEAETLATMIRTVLTEAIEGGGSTGDYTDVEGTAGRYTPRVYERGGMPCLVCGTPLTRIRLGGRGTVFCGVCQN
jgi:formamidopyrimidine-DNA glycosylase